MQLELLLTGYDTQVAKNAEKKVEEALTVLLHELREYLFLLAIIIVFDNQYSIMDAVSIHSPISITSESQHLTRALL